MSDNQENGHEKAAKNPKEDMDALDKNLADAQRNHMAAAEELGYQRSIGRLIRPFWDNIKISESSPPVLTSGAAMISDWRAQSESWKRQSEYQLSNIQFGVATASTAAYNTVSMDKLFMPKPLVDADKVESVVSQKDERAFVEKRLRLIDEALANLYHTIWQYFYLPALDPVRGPLFLMRQVFDDLLTKLAPDEDINRWSDFVRDEELFKRDRKGITRAHRIQFVANNKIGSPKRQLVLDSTRNFIFIYDELNRAHARHELDENAGKSAVLAASRLIAEWLLAIDSK
jgi:hypothetical protein